MKSQDLSNWNNSGKENTMRDTLSSKTKWFLWFWQGQFQPDMFYRKKN